MPMPAAAILRAQIEEKLANRIPAALSLKIKQTPEFLPTGTTEIDAMLDGGIPRGSITEISGASSAGKTSFALCSVATMTQSGAACAWVDVSDALSPESAAAAGVELKRLLWLRTAGECQHAKEQVLFRLEQAIKATGLLLKAGGFAAIVLDMSDVHSRHTMRIPLSTWYGFRLAAEQARTALIFLTQSPCASSCAALVLHCEPARINPLSAAGETDLLDGQQHIVTRERNRNERASFAQKKPSGRAAWKTETTWSRVR